MASDLAKISNRLNKFLAAVAVHHLTAKGATDASGLARPLRTADSIRYYLRLCAGCNRDDVLDDTYEHCVRKGARRSRRPDGAGNPAKGRKTAEERQKLSPFSYTECSDEEDGGKEGVDRDSAEGNTPEDKEPVVIDRTEAYDLRYVSASRTVREGGYPKLRKCRFRMEVKMKNLDDDEWRFRIVSVDLGEVKNGSRVIPTDYDEYDLRKKLCGDGTHYEFDEYDLRDAFRRGGTRFENREYMLDEDSKVWVLEEEAFPGNGQSAPCGIWTTSPGPFLPGADLLLSHQFLEMRCMDLRPTIDHPGRPVPWVHDARRELASARKEYNRAIGDMALGAHNPIQGLQKDFTESIREAGDDLRAVLDGIQNASRSAKCKASYGNTATRRVMARTALLAIQSLPGGLAGALECLLPSRPGARGALKSAFRLLGMGSELRKMVRSGLVSPFVSLAFSVLHRSRYPKTERDFRRYWKHCSGASLAKNLERIGVKGVLMDQTCNMCVHSEDAKGLLLKMAAPSFQPHIANERIPHIWSVGRITKAAASLQDISKLKSLLTLRLATGCVPMGEFLANARFFSLHVCAPTVLEFLQQRTRDAAADTNWQRALASANALSRLIKLLPNAVSNKSIDFPARIDSLGKQIYRDKNANVHELAMKPTCSLLDLDRIAQIRSKVQDTATAAVIGGPGGSVQYPMTLVRVVQSKTMARNTAITGKPLAQSPNLNPPLVYKGQLLDLSCAVPTLGDPDAWLGFGVFWDSGDMDDWDSPDACLDLSCMIFFTDGSSKHCAWDNQRVYADEARTTLLAEHGGDMWGLLGRVKSEKQSDGTPDPFATYVMENLRIWPRRMRDAGVERVLLAGINYTVTNLEKGDRWDDCYKDATFFVFDPAAGGAHPSPPPLCAR